MAVKHPTEPKLKAPTFGKFDVRDLFHLIAGGKKPLTVKKLERWRKLIMYAVNSMRHHYENPDMHDDLVRAYYKEDWDKIDAAENNKKLIEALAGLCISIEWE